MSHPLFLSRRRFLQVSSVGLTAIGSARLAAGEAPPVRAGRSQPKRFTIDCHQHFQPRPLYFETLLTFYKERNAMACCNGFRAQYPAILEAAKKNPDTIIPFGRLVMD